MHVRRVHAWNNGRIVNYGKGGVMGSAERKTTECVAMKLSIEQTNQNRHKNIKQKETSTRIDTPF